MAKFPVPPAGLTPGYFIDAEDDGDIDDRPVPVYGRDLKESPPVTQERAVQLLDPEWCRRHGYAPPPVWPDRETIEDDH